MEDSIRGPLLLAVLVAPKAGTTSPSDNYEAVSFTAGGKDASSKYYLLKYFSDMSKKNPTEILSMRHMDPIPVVMESWQKNSTFYGLKFEMTKPEAKCPLNIEITNLHQPSNIWLFKQSLPGQYSTRDFSNLKLLPNETPPTCMVTGTLAIEATVGNLGDEQILVNIHGAPENNNSLSVVLTQHGDFVYSIIKDGMPFAEMSISPPSGKSFEGKHVFITVESLHPKNRKYGKDISDQVTIFRLSCPELGFEKIVPQAILWNWKHPEGSITDSDKANAQCFAFLQFSSFVPSMTHVSIGNIDESGESRFLGTIHKTQFAPTLPSGQSDFWNN